MPNETIAVFTKNRSNPAYAAARLGAERVAQRLGARVRHYVPGTPDSIEQQIGLVEAAVAARPDAMVFAPVHLTALDAAVRQVNDAGIPVVNYLNRLAAGRFVSFVGADDVRLGREIADCLFRRLGGRGDVIVLEGVPGAVTSRDRLRGFLAAADAQPEIRIVATLTGDYLEESARRVMSERLATLPRFDGVLAANDAMALGVLDALAAGGRHVPVTGVNALPEAIAAIKAGRMLATVDFDALKIACVATEAAIRHLRGESVPREIILPAQIVDAANLGPWEGPLEARTCPRWEDVVAGLPRRRPDS